MDNLTIFESNCDIPTAQLPCHWCLIHSAVSASKVKFRRTPRIVSLCTPACLINSRIYILQLFILSFNNSLVILLSLTWKALSSVWIHCVVLFDYLRDIVFVFVTIFGGHWSQELALSPILIVKVNPRFYILVEDLGICKRLHFVNCLQAYKSILRLY